MKSAQKIALVNLYFGYNMVGTKPHIKLNGREYERYSYLL